MSDPVTQIKYIGPAYAEALASIGITTADALRALGADAAYGKLLRAGQRPHFIGYYALVMALQGRPWNDCKGAEKAALRKRFDALKEEHHDTGLMRLEAELDSIGVISRKTRGAI